jgi:hypothetical protein
MYWSLVDSSIGERAGARLEIEKTARQRDEHPLTSLSDGSPT